jgi:hypothetical protein
MRRRRQNARDVDGDVACADDDGGAVREVELRISIVLLR